MMQGRIARLVRHRVESRVDGRLATAWISEAVSPTTWQDGTWLRRTAPLLVPATDAPVLVFLGSGVEGVRATLLDCAKRGARVYALVGPGWGKDEADAQLLQVPRLLVRRVDEVPASAVHAGTTARVWIGGGFTLDLDPSQAEALRQNFLRLFWHEATEEAWTGGKQFVWRPARERPFDVPEIPDSALVRWEPADAQLTEPAAGSLMHIAAGLPPTTAPRRLWFPAGPTKHDRLSTLVQRSVEVLWSDRGLPDLQVNGDEGEVLLPGARGRLRLRLTAPQAREMARVFEASPAWRFQIDVRLGEASHRAAQFWLSGEAAPRGLEAEQRVDVSDVAASSLRVVASAEPAAVPPAQPLALSVRYQWTVVPPRVPAGHEEDELVKRWRDLDDDWTKRIAHVRDALDNSDRERSRIADAFARFVSGVLGFSLTQSELLDEVSALNLERPSKSGPSGASNLLARLAKLEASAKNHHEEIEAAERKARVDEAKEQQQLEWSRQVERSKKDADKAREALAKAEARETELANEAKETEGRLAHAESDEKKDLDARQKKNSDERKAHAELLKRLRYELEKLESDAARSFNFIAPPIETKAQQPQGKRFVPPAAPSRASINVPEDALPEVGLLRIHKGERYLVIDAWEQLDAGEQAAARLSAKLVAPEDA